MKPLPRQYQLVRVRAIRDARFVDTVAQFERHPSVGDVGTVLEVYTNPEPGFEVECSDSSTGKTIWLEAMYADELEPVANATKPNGA